MGNASFSHFSWSMWQNTCTSTSFEEIQMSTSLEQQRDFQTKCEMRKKFEPNMAVVFQCEKCKNQSNYEDTMTCSGAAFWEEKRALKSAWRRQHNVPVNSFEWTSHRCGRWQTRPRRLKNSSRREFEPEIAPERRLRTRMTMYDFEI